MKNRSGAGRGEGLGDELTFDITDYNSILFLDYAIFLQSKIYQINKIHKSLALSIQWYRRSCPEKKETFQSGHFLRFSNLL